MNNDIDIIFNNIEGETLKIEDSFEKETILGFQIDFHSEITREKILNESKKIERLLDIMPCILEHSDVLNCYSFYDNFVDNESMSQTSFMRYVNGFFNVSIKYKIRHIKELQRLLYTFSKLLLSNLDIIKFTKDKNDFELDKTDIRVISLNSGILKSKYVIHDKILLSENKDKTLSLIKFLKDD